MTEASERRTPRHVPRSILLTGGAGFIGSNLAHHLLAADPQIHLVNLDLLTYAGDKHRLDDLPDPARHRFVQGDVADPALVAELMAVHQIDTVIHLAAESHVDRSITGPVAFIRSNILGTYTLLEAARQRWLDDDSVDAGACRFHHVSTDEVYGELSEQALPASEGTAYAPSSHYAASKAAFDHLVRSWARTFNLPVTLSNCSNNYGPRQHGEKLIPTVIRACLERRSIPVYGTGSNIRDWLHVCDHCEAIWYIVRYGLPSETYNVGANNEWRNIDLIRRLCSTVASVLAVPEEELLSLITFVADRPGHDHRYAIDNAKLGALGWRAGCDFDDGIEETVRWYLDHEAKSGVDASAAAVP